MQVFWDISPSPQSPPAPMADTVDTTHNRRTAICATYLLTQSMLESSSTEFSSDATRESMMRWASEESGAPR